MKQFRHGMKVRCVKKGCMRAGLSRNAKPVGDTIYSLKHTGDWWDIMPEDENERGWSVSNNEEFWEFFEEVTETQPTLQPTKEDILEEALRITSGDRQNSYGPPDQDFRRTADMVNALYGTSFAPVDIAKIMILLKLSRSQHQGKRDNWVDIAGYARCGAVCEEVAKG